MLLASILISLLAGVYGQQVSTLTAEVHPPLDWESCTAEKGCATQNGLLTLDASWRDVFEVNTTNYCFYSSTQNSSWNTTICPDDITCAENCGLNGADYEVDVGVLVEDNSLLKLNHPSAYDGSDQPGSRVFLMANDTHYQTFNLLNKEFSFQVDVSRLPCELNGALYFVAMDADGGVARYPSNKAGAKYGTGYCDASCSRSELFVNGWANAEDWVYSTAISDGSDLGLGLHGSCCPEIDIWEANAVSTSLIVHPCDTPSQTICNGVSGCGGADGVSPDFDPCASDGCDFNPYRMGNTTFYGENLILDTTNPFTVVTQFLTNDNTSTGTLSEIKRFYVQNGITIPNPSSNIVGVAGNSITASYCTAKADVFDENDKFDAHGGLKALGGAMANGMVLTFMSWRDKYNGMLWLDGVYPPTANTSSPGVVRGTCPYDASYVEDLEPSASVQFSQIRFGDIGSTV